MEQPHTSQLLLHPEHPGYAYPRYRGEVGFLRNCDREMEKKDTLDQRVQEPSSPISDQDSNAPALTHEALREYMVTHQVKGTKPMPIRTPFIGEITTFESLSEPGVKFGIRRLSNGQVMAHRDRNSVVRFITESSDEETERYVQERDYPAGTMTVDIAVLGLATWNIQDDKGHDIPINQENILRYLDPEELDFVSEKVLEVNPIISNRNAQKKRTRDDSGDTDGGNSGGNDTPPVRPVLSSDRATTRDV